MKISELLSSLQEGPFATDKNKCKKRGHCYGWAYDHIFSTFDRESELDVIEIGTRWGNSLLAWREFFPNAKISGVDIADLVENKHPGIEYIISDVKALTPENEFDIVIDDGSHKLHDALYVVKNFKLKVGGVMIIEDCKAPVHWSEAISKETKYSMESIDLRDMYGQHDDFLIVLRNYGYYQ